MDFVWVWFGGHISDAQGLFLTLCSAITPDELVGPEGMPGLNLGQHVQTKFPTHCINFLTQNVDCSDKFSWALSSFVI